jgi:hypothetical protein
MASISSGGTARRNLGRCPCGGVVYADRMPVACERRDMETVRRLSVGQ